MSAKLELYVSSAAFKEISDAISFCKKHSVGLEISRYTNPELVDSLTQEDLQEVRNQLSTLSIVSPIQHGPFFDLSPVSLDPKILDVFNYRAKQALEIGTILNSKVLVFHSGYNAHVKLESYKIKFIEKQIEYWKEFISTYDLGDIIITLENTYEEDPYILKEICKGVNSEKLQICIDMGHINVYSNKSYNYWFRELKEYICHFHLHNNDGTKDQHLSLSNGVENFNAVFKDIIKMNKNLTLTLEMFDSNDLLDSILFIQKNHFLQS